jgi:hypothetical protein
MRCYDFEKEFLTGFGAWSSTARRWVQIRPRSSISASPYRQGRTEESSRQSAQHYRITGVGDDGLWKVLETKSEFKQRADVRFWTPIDLYLALVDRKDGSLGGERTTAENVSRSGAAVFTTLDVGIGDRVKFISEQFDFSGLAVVCNRQIGDDERTRVHL